MNKNIFQTLFGQEHIANAIISSSESKDDLGVVLRLHLVTENYLEAFICAAIGKEDLFDTEPSEGKAFKLNYYKKLELASKFGLPISSFKAFDKLNSLRNSVAHRIQTDFIDDAVIASLTSHVTSIDGNTDSPLVEQSAEFFNGDGSSRELHHLNSNNSPNRIKLMIIVSALIRRTTERCIGI